MLKSGKGDFATCRACKSLGQVLNDAYPHFTLQSGKQILVRGARVMCNCPNKPLIIPSQHNFNIEVNRQSHTPPRGGQGAYASPIVGRSEYAAHTSEKVTDQQSGLVDDPELICPNMSNAQFGRLMMGFRDEAVAQVNARLRQLSRWSQADQAWFHLWFGTTDQAARSTIANGLARMRGVLELLTPSNFIRYTGKMTRNPGPGGCISRNSPGAVAEVCAPDTATHTIVIKLSFCELRDRHASLDSKLLTLVHEVSHFNDVFGSRDIKYSTWSAKIMAKSKDARAIENADNIAGYVICSE